MPRHRIHALLVGAGLLASLAACQDGALSRFFRKRPPVVLISIDTLRADRLPAYGFKGVETPAIDALRRDSILFENAFSHVPLTLPSHATIFTGRLPAANGVRDNSGYELRTGVLTLAEVLKGAGYATGGAVSAIVLAKSTGISRGFDFWDDVDSRFRAHGVGGSLVGVFAPSRPTTGEGVTDAVVPTSMEAEAAVGAGRPSSPGLERVLLERRARVGDRVSLVAPSGLRSASRPGACARSGHGFVPFCSGRPPHRDRTKPKTSPAAAETSFVAMKRSQRPKMT